MLTCLDDSQRAFCEAPLENIRLLAPVGCGKTQCLLHRSRHLVDISKRRTRILIFTFTRVARDELRSRLGDFQLEDSVEVTTLNAWGFRRIRSSSFSPKLITSRADYHFAMLNQLQSIWQRFKHVKEAIQTANRWRKANAPKVLMDMMDSFKSLGFDHIRHKERGPFLAHWARLDSQNLQWRLMQHVEDLKKIEILEEEHFPPSRDVMESDKVHLYERFYRFWCKATDHLLREATFTLEDQKYFAYQDEQKNVEDGKFLTGAARHAHVFVDEFQDINPLDLALIKAIVERNRATLTIAGDDDQAIFEWRGATPEYIMEPGRFFDLDFSTRTLAVNYRSPFNIVKHSQALIQHNRRRVQKDVRASSAKEARIEVRKTIDLADALNFVKDLVDQSVSEGRSPSRVALVSRKRSQIIPYQVFFASRDISFCAAEDLQVFLSNAFNRLVELLEVKSGSVPRTRVVTTVLSLCDLVKRYPLNRVERETLRKHMVDARPKSMEAGVDSLSSYKGNLKGANAGGQTSVAMAEALREFMEAPSVPETLVVLGQRFDGLQFDFGKSEEDVFFADPPFVYLAQYARRYQDFDSFIEDVEKARETLVHVPPFDEGDGRPLSNHPLHLMTALRSKGKEFDVVVLLDVVEGMWPNRNARTQDELEGERRVFYVAFTRARERVVMLTSRTHDPSPYIAELGLPTS